MSAHENRWQPAGIHRRHSALRSRYWRVQTKLIAVLAIPSLGFLTLAGVQTSQSVRAASDLDGFSRQVAIGVEVTALMHELQRERDRTAGMLAATTAPADANPQPRDVSELESEWTAVDRAVARWESAARPLRDQAALSGAYEHAKTLLDELARVRAGVGEGWLRTGAAFAMYTETIAGLQALLPSPVDVGGNTELGRLVRGFTNLARAKELTAQIRGRLYIICSGTGAAAGTVDLTADVRAERQAATDRFRSDASADQLASFDDVVAGQAVRNTSRLEQAIITAGAAAGASVDPQQWWAASTTELELMRTVEQSLLASATSAVGQASGAQWRSTVAGSLTSIALLLAAVLLSVVIGRNMAFSLRALREQALLVAEVKLPAVIEQLRLSPTDGPPQRVDRITIGSHDEIADVAEAFTAVHRSAVRLAAEQASMRRNVNEIFKKLALRSQTLVERQLQLLDSMESAEVDPEQLDKLFRLDHLATRLRRNDENLLVLVGGDTSRHWNQPKDLSTIVLAATAEVEHYERVRQETAEGVFVVGHAVSDLVNLLAELLENGTAFSSPQTLVQVHGHALPDGSAELVIVDEGLGMSEQALRQANEQVSAAVSIDSSAAERMGLVVVGHLAMRHGVGVLLQSQGPGTTVRVRIPSTLVVPPPEELPEAGRARWLRADPAPVRAAVAVGDTQVLTRATSRRPTPVRAEDVLAPDRRKPSIWWSQEEAAKRTPAAPAPRARQAQAPAALTEAGLPVRVRMANLPADAENKPVETVYEADPEVVGDTLSRLYSGVRRADTEAAEAATSSQVDR